MYKPAKLSDIELHAERLNRKYGDTPWKVIVINKADEDKLTDLLVPNSKPDEKRYAVETMR